MDEAVRAALDYGFGALKFTTITAFPQRYNTKSQAVLEKNNFIRKDNVAGDSPEYMFYELSGGAR